MRLYHGHSCRHCRRVAEHRRPVNDQHEFLFADGHAPQLEMPWADDPLIADIAKAWGLPVGKNARIHLKDSESIPVLEGRLELTSAPDLPFDARQPLSLRIRGYKFSSRAITSWATVE